MLASSSISGSEQQHDSRTGSNSTELRSVTKVCHVADMELQPGAALALLLQLLPLLPPGGAVQELEQIDPVGQTMLAGVPRRGMAYPCSATSA